MRQIALNTNKKWVKYKKDRRVVQVNTIPSESCSERETGEWKDHQHSNSGTQQRRAQW